MKIILKSVNSSFLQVTHLLMSKTVTVSGEAVQTNYARLRKLQFFPRKGLRSSLFIAVLMCLASFGSHGSEQKTLKSPANERFCSVMVQIESVLSSSIPLVVLPEEMAQKVANYQLGKLKPLFSEARQIAPIGIATAVDRFTTALTQKLSKLDFSVTQTSEFATADNVIDTKVLADCGFDEMEVIAVNYEYLGIPELKSAGKTALILKNESDEVHEISVARINDDVDLSPKEILSLPEEESLASIELIAYAEVLPGGTETTFMELDDGRYYAVCFTPRGTMSLQSFGDGAPHLFHGMLKEFTVGAERAHIKTNVTFNPNARSTPEELLALLGQHIDARDIDAILSIHEPSAGIVEWTGALAKGDDEIRRVYTEFFATKPNLKVNARQIIEIDDVAVILGDYTLEFLGRNGKTINTSGKFGDIVRRQPDGKWLYLLDNPWAP